MYASFAHHRVFICITINFRPPTLQTSRGACRIWCPHLSSEHPGPGPGRPHVRQISSVAGERAGSQGAALRQTNFGLGIEALQKAEGE